MRPEESSTADVVTVALQPTIAYILVFIWICCIRLRGADSVGVFVQSTAANTCQQSVEQFAARSKFTEENQDITIH